MTVKKNQEELVANLSQTVESLIQLKVDEYLSNYLTTTFPKDLEKYAKEHIDTLVKYAVEMKQEEIKGQFASAFTQFFNGVPSKTSVQKSEQVFPKYTLPGDEEEDEVDESVNKSEPKSPPSLSQRRADTINRVNDEIAIKLDPFFRKVMGNDTTINHLVFARDLLKVCEGSGYGAKHIGRSFSMIYPDYHKFYGVRESSKDQERFIIYIHKSYYTSMVIDKIKGTEESQILEYFTRPQNYLGTSRSRVLKELFGLYPVSELGIKEVYKLVVERFKKINGMTLHIGRGIDPNFDKHRVTTCYRLIRQV